MCAARRSTSRAGPIFPFVASGPEFERARGRAFTDPPWAERAHSGLCRRREVGYPAPVSRDEKLPKGRLGRLRRLAGVGLRVGADAVRAQVGGNKDGDGGGATAERAAQVLGQLRGVAAKVGQMAGYIDGVVPEGQRDNYERWMKTLMDQAPRSSLESVRATVAADLGRPLEACFSEFSPEPIASASIGQVHRARLSDGREVAVKVQHAGIADAMNSDLKNAGLLEGSFRLFAGRKFESKRILDEIRARFREELDYELEARRQIAMFDIHADDPAVHIPEVFESHCGPRVLTMEWVEGMNFDAAREADEALRRQWAETMWRFVYKGTLIGGLFNADPHPGNYIFHADGRVSFLDFGCVQESSAEQKRKAIETHRAASRRDIEAFDRAAVIMMDMRGGEYQRNALGYIHAAFAPVLQSPYKIEREYVAGLASHFKQVFDSVRKAKDDEYVPFPEGMIFFNRLQFGFYSVLARLDVEVDYARIERSFLDPRADEAAVAAPA